MRQAVSTPTAPAAIGPYSQAIRAGNLLFLSGQIPLDPATGNLVEGGVEAQTRQVFRNIGEILKAAGSDLTRVLKMTVYISDIEFWSAVNAVYARVMGEHRPARAMVPVKELHYGFKIEIEAIAATA